MKRYFTLICTILLSVCTVSADELTMTVSGMSTTMTNTIGTRKIVANINSSGRVSSLTIGGTELLGSNGIYFDYTTANGNQGLSPSAIKVIKNTPDYCEVLYSATSGNTIFEQGFIMRKGVQKLYTYVIATGTATSASEPIKEARVCTRTAESLLYGYVDYRMNGKIPSNSEMAVAEQNEVQDATYTLADGSIYTKYNWANYIERDTLHGLSNGKYYGIYNIPVSYEWLNGGCDRQELTVHATSKSPITIQMLQGEHFGGQAMVLNDGEKKLYGPFVICPTYSTNPVTYARNQAIAEAKEWPYQWFENELYPRERGTVRGHLNVTTGQRNDSVRIILAQEKGKEPIEMMHGYQFWTLTDENGDFEIKNVRPGAYNLFAYAKAGEVTDMLEQDDITVVAGENNLGTVTWTPKKYTQMLWMIGQNNRRSDEFNFCDELRQYGLWEKVPNSLVYTIGESKENKDWYYAQTRNNGTWTIKFNLDSRPTGRVYLTASIAGCSGNNSQITVTVNGTQRGTWKPGVNDACVYRSALNSGRHYLFTTDFLNTDLKAGENTVQLKLSGAGSKDGIMYDCIKLEAGDIVTGSCGENLFYFFNEATGTLTISGTGAMSDYKSSSEVPWSSYRNSIKKVVLNNGVTSIGQVAFQWCSGLKSVDIPNSVTSIGYGAFNGCSGLTSVDIPKSVTSIRSSAFINCSSLTSIKVESGNTTYDSRNNCNAIIETSGNTLIAGCKKTIIPNSVTSIGELAFYGCSGLTSIEIPNSVTSIGQQAFEYCSGLTSIVIPNSVTSIGRFAFDGCGNLTSVDIPNSVTSIGSDAFQGCFGLISIVIPNSVTTIGEGAFSNCTSLTSIKVESGNTTYDSRNNCNAIIETSSSTLIAGCKNTVIPNSVTSIGDHTFRGCSSLTSMVIPNSVTSIGVRAFNGCSGLTSIEIPNSVTSIGHQAFSYCSGLTFIEISNSVTSIGDYAFSGCSGLTSVTCLAESVPTTDSNAFYNSPISSATLYVPVGSKAAYEAADVWKDFKEIVEIEAATASIYFFDDALLETNAAGLSQLTYADGATIVLNTSNKYFFKGKSTTVGDKSYIAIKFSTGAENIFTAPKGKTVTGVKFYSYINSADEAKPSFWAQVGDKTYTADSEDVQILNSHDSSDPDVTTYTIAPASSFTFKNSGYQLCFVMEVTYGDALISVQDTKAYIGKTVSADIDLTNSTEDLTAYQFDLTLPEGLSLSQNDKGEFLVTKTNRYEDDSQTLNISKLEGNTYRFVCFSMSNEVITGTSGAILNASLTIGESVNEGSYEATISNIVVTKTDGSQLKLSDAKFNIVVTNVIKGDANGDGEVNVSDIVEIVNYIMNKPSDKFVFAAADVNEDGEVNVTDIVKVVSIIMSANSSQAKMSATQAEMTDNDQVQLIENEDQNISLTLNNEGGYVASQFDLVLSDNQSLESIQLNNNRTDNHILTYTKTGTNRYRVLSYSLNNAIYGGHSGELLDIKVAGSGDVSVEDILFVTAEETEKRFSPLHSVTTGISVTTKQAEAVDIYGIDGRLVHKQARSTDRLERGFYIINGKKYIAR